MKDCSYVRNHCRLCGSTDLELGLSLAPTPIGDDYLRKERLGESLPLFNLDLCLCSSCGQVQLRDVVSPQLLYSGCSYITSTSPGFPEHLRVFASQIVENYQIKPGSLVVEIGSNEGLMLRAFQEHQCHVCGVEPDAQIAELATKAGVPSIGSFFTSKTAREIVSAHGYASVLAASHEFANIDDLDDALIGVRDLLAPDGILVMESSYWSDVVTRGLIDTVYHEHLSYLSVAPLDRFFEAHEMEIIDARRNTDKGGSIQLAVQRKGGRWQRKPAVAEIICEERIRGIHNLDALKAWGERLEKTSLHMQEMLKGHKSRGKRIAGFGASVATTTMLYEFGIGQLVDCLVDDNPEKHGKYSPGLQIPCGPSSWIEDTKADCVIVFAWRYWERIRNLLSSFRSRGGSVVVPLPDLRILD